MDIEDEIKGSGEDLEFAGENFRNSHGLGTVNCGKVPLNVCGS
jgi:hypothetical protein